MGKPANYDQDSFRYRNDDGSETLATWLYGVNTDGDLEVDANYRLRFLVQEDNGGSGQDVDLEFQYNLNGAGWNNITTTSSVVKAVASANFANGDDCTQQVGAGVFIGNNDGMTEDGTSGGTNLDFAGNEESETELCFQIISGDVANNDTIQIRLVRDSGTLLDSYANTPSISVNEAQNLVKEGPAETLQLSGQTLRFLGLVRARGETAQVADGVLRGLSLRRIVSETIQVADEALNFKMMFQVAAETIQITGAVLRGLSLARQADESSQVVDASIRLLSLRRAVDESSQLADGFLRFLSMPRGADETVQISDAGLGSRTLWRVVAEMTQISDDAQELLAALLSKMVGETIQLSDVLLRGITAVRRASSIVQVSDQRLRFLGLVRLKDETIQLTDALVRRLALRRIIDETVQITDSALDVIGKGLVKLANETVQISDQALRWLALRRVVAETVELTDGFLVVRALARVVAETVQITDVAVTSFAGALVKFANEVVQLADSAVRNIDFVRVMGETLQLADGILFHFVGALIKMANEAVQLSGSAARNLSLARVADSSVQVVDGLLRWLGFSKIAVDVVQLSDATGRVGTLRRIINESVYLAGDIYSNKDGDMTDWQKYAVTGDGPNQMTDQGGYFRIECADWTDYPSAYVRYRYSKAKAYTWQDYKLWFKYLGRGGSLPDTALVWFLRYSLVVGDNCGCWYTWVGSDHHKFNITAYNRILHLKLFYVLQPGDVVRTECSGPPGNVLESIYVNDVMKYSQTNISLASYPCAPSGTIVFGAGGISVHGDTWWEFDDILVAVTCVSRFLDLRKLVPEDVRIADAPIPGKIFYRIMAEAVDIAEQTMHIHIYARMVGEVMNIFDQDFSRFGGHLIRIINETARMIDVIAVFDIPMSSIVPRAFARVFRAGRRPKTFYKE